MGQEGKGWHKAGTTEEEGTGGSGGQNGMVIMAQSLQLTWK